MNYKVRHLNHIVYLFLSVSIGSALITIMDLLYLKLGIIAIATVAIWAVSSSLGWYLTYRYAKQLESNKLSIADIRKGVSRGIRFKVVDRDIGRILSETESRLRIVRRDLKSSYSSPEIVANTSNHLNEIISDVYEIRDYYIFYLLSKGQGQEDVGLLFGLSVDEINAIINKG